MTKAYILYVHHKFYKISYIALIFYIALIKRLIISKKNTFFAFFSKRFLIFFKDLLIDLEQQKNT